MHPDAAFGLDDPARLAALVDQIGFGMVVAATPDGLRVAHVPMVIVDGAVQFHLARRNALTPYLDGATALIVINGPHAYISPRWYANRAQVPTWDYLAIEIDGSVTRLSDAALRDQVAAVTARAEAGIAQPPWTLDAMTPAAMRGLLDAIIGFELTPQAWRGTAKWSQNKPAADRARVAAELAARGDDAAARAVRDGIGA